MGDVVQPWDHVWNDFGVFSDGTVMVSGDNDGTIRRLDLGLIDEIDDLATRVVPMEGDEKTAADPTVLKDWLKWHGLKQSHDAAWRLTRRFRAAGGEMSSLTRARMAWRAGQLDEAAMAYKNALGANDAGQVPLRFYLSLCLRAVEAQRSAKQKAVGRTSSGAGGGRSMSER